jgi:hypothetical protein
LQDAPGVATKMKDEITYKPQNDATFDSKADRTLISPIPFPATLFRSPI